MPTTTQNPLHRAQRLSFSLSYRLLRTEPYSREEGERYVDRILCDGVRGFTLEA